MPILSHSPLFVSLLFLFHLCQVSVWQSRRPCCRQCVSASSKPGHVDAQPPTPLDWADEQHLHHKQGGGDQRWESSAVSLCVHLYIRLCLASPKLLQSLPGLHKHETTIILRLESTATTTATATASVSPTTTPTSSPGRQTSSHPVHSLHTHTHTHTHTRTHSLTHTRTTAHVMGSANRLTCRNRAPSAKRTLVLFSPLTAPSRLRGTYCRYQTGRPGSPEEASVHRRLTGEYSVDLPTPARSHSTSSARGFGVFGGCPQRKCSIHLFFSNLVVRALTYTDAYTPRPGLYLPSCPPQSSTSLLLHSLPLATYFI